MIATWRSTTISRLKNSSSVRTSAPRATMSATYSRVAGLCRAGVLVEGAHAYAALEAP